MGIFLLQNLPADKESLSLTALIPVIFGVILILCNKGLKNNNKTVAHVAVLVTFIALLGLFMPLKSAIGDNRMLSIVRVSLMILSSLVAMFTFINSLFKLEKINRELTVKLFLFFK